MGHLTFGSLARRLIAWAILLLVAILAVKVAVALVAGLLATVVSVAALVLVAMAVVWALRHL